jgi:hypothetical protein
VVARIVPRGKNGCYTYVRIVSQEKTRKSPDLGRATSVQCVVGGCSLAGSLELSREERAL